MVLNPLQIKSYLSSKKELQQSLDQMVVERVTWVMQFAGYLVNRVQNNCVVLKWKTLFLQERN